MYLLYLSHIHHSSWPQYKHYQCKLLSIMRLYLTKLHIGVSNTMHPPGPKITRYHGAQKGKHSKQYLKHSSIHPNLSTKIELTRISIGMPCYRSGNNSSPESLVIKCKMSTFLFIFPISSGKFLIDFVHLQDQNKLSAATVMIWNEFCNTGTEVK